MAAFEVITEDWVENLRTGQRVEFKTKFPE